MIQGIEIVFYTDPLCCWSFAMQQQWKQLITDSAIRYRYCMGGLLPSWDQFHDPVNAVSRPVQMGPIWMQATHLTGVAINNRIWISDPPSSSYLACMAVKAAEEQGFSQAERLYFRLQQCVMQDAGNIARLGTVLDCAASAELDRDALYNSLHNGQALERFRKDLDEVNRNRVERFPSFLVRQEGRPTRMISGYQTNLAKIIYNQETNSTPSEMPGSGGS